jgi:Lrp/AsnC family leucine-responsive transcriptional regulator
MDPSRIDRGIDKIDRRILRVLQADGRISNLKLAETVHLSPTAVLERVKRLTRDGYILGYEARLNPVKLGAGLLVFVEVLLDRTVHDVMDTFKAAVQVRPEILEAHLVAGGFDYLLKTRVADMAAYREFIGSVIWTLPGVRETRTYAVMEEVKNSVAAADVSRGLQRPTEDRRAHAHQGGAFGTAASRSALMPIDKVSSARPWALTARVTVRAVRGAAHAARSTVTGRLGNGHQPAQPHALGRQRGHRGGQRRHFGRQHAALAGLAADVDLQAQLQRRQPGRALFGQALRDLQPVDRLHPVEGLGHRARLVALQRADQVPLQLRAQVGQGLDLGQRLLHVVLAEGALPGGMRLAHRLGAEGLADGQQRDAVLVARRPPCRPRLMRPSLLAGCFRCCP